MNKDIQPLDPDSVRGLRVAAARMATTVIEADLGRLPLFQVVCNAVLTGMVSSAKNFNRHKDSKYEDIFAACVACSIEELLHKPWTPSNE